MVKAVIIMGSSHSGQDTQTVGKALAEASGFPLIDITQYDITYFDYEHKNQGDDYLSLMEGIIESYDLLIFLSPIYWYSMSAVMKNFFDRMTDLLTIKKEVGRKLRGKSMAAISSANGEEGVDSFFSAFQLSADYLGMTYLGETHIQVEKKGALTQVGKESLQSFLVKLSSQQEP
ncbi:MAG: NAD(P)H-dependent oxidoreductase [Bacteroidota bacterium]